MWKTARSDETSYRARSRSGRRQIRCIIVGTAYIQSTRYSATRASAPAASKRGITTRWFPASKASSDVVNGPLWYSGPVTRWTPSRGMRSSAANPSSGSHAAGCVATISFGRPVLPPDVGALNEAAITGGNGSDEIDASGAKPAGIVARPGASPGSTPTTSDGFARSMIARRSAAGSRDEIGWGVAPAFQTASTAS